MTDAMVSASFTPNVQRGSEEIARFIEVLVASHSMRRLGSAALNLCYVGAGRLDAYWATGVKSWDVAAGVLIARESGATLSDLVGGPFQLSHPKLAIAANALLHSQLLAILRRATL
jgi:myo-inositol-1(or 4)-monophosphatase